MPAAREDSPKDVKDDAGRGTVRTGLIAGRCRRRVRTAGPTSWRMRTSRVLAPPGRPAFNAMRIRRAQR